MYDGAARELDVVVPRIGRVDISIDGRLDEAAWLEAAVLTGFFYPAAWLSRIRSV